MSGEVNPYCSIEANLNATDDQDKNAQMISENLSQLSSLFQDSNKSTDSKKSVKESIADATIAATQESHESSDEVKSSVDVKSSGAVSSSESSSGVVSLSASGAQALSPSQERFVEKFQQKMAQLRKQLDSLPHAKDPMEMEKEELSLKKKLGKEVNSLVQKLNKAKRSGKIDEATFGDLKSQLSPYAALNGDNLKINSHGVVEVVKAPPGPTTENALTRSIEKTTEGVRDLINKYGDGDDPYKKYLEQMLQKLDAMMKAGHTFAALMFCLYTLVPAANEVQEDTVNGYSKQLNTLGTIRDDVAAVQQDITNDNGKTMVPGKFEADMKKLRKDINTAHNKVPKQIDDATYDDLMGKDGKSGKLGVNGTVEKGLADYGKTVGETGDDKIIQKMWENSTSTDPKVGPVAINAQNALLKSFNMANQSVSTVSSGARTKMKYWMDKIQQVMGFENNLMHAEFKMVQAPVDNQKVN